MAIVLVQHAPNLSLWDLYENLLEEQLYEHIHRLTGTIYPIHLKSSRQWASTQSHLHPLRQSMNPPSAAVFPFPGRGLTV